MGPPHLPSSSPHESPEGCRRETGRNVETKEGEGLEKAKGLIVFSQIHLLRDCVVLSGLVPPTSLVIEENLSDMAIGQSGQRSSSVDVPSSQMTIGGIQLTIKT